MPARIYRDWRSANYAPLHAHDLWSVKRSLINSQLFLLQSGCR